MSFQVREVFIDAEVNRYGYPLPWLSKGLGDAVLTFDRLVEQARAPPRIDLVAFVLDFAFYTAAMMTMISAVLGLVIVLQYVGQRFLRKTRS